MLVVHWLRYPALESQATYTSSAGNVPQANPIVLDSSGRVSNEVWLTSGIGYKFLLKDSSGVQIGSWDNLSGIVGSASVVTSISGGTTGLTPNTGTQGDVVLAGTLAQTNGGTGLTTSGTAGNKLASDGVNWISAQDTYLGVGTYALGYSTVSYTVSSSNAGSLFTPSLPGTWTVFGVGPTVSSNIYYLLYRTS